MLIDQPTIPIVSLALISFAVAMYLILDGINIGVGIMFLLIKGDSKRNVMMGSALPVWDENQTWMIMAGAGLYGAFPLIYSTVLRAMYFPIVLMLIAIIYRGIAFEFRGKSSKYRKLFDVSFYLGSTFAAFAQGVVLGGIISGGWLFSLFCGLCLVCGYALLGACWLVVKTDGDLQQRLDRAVRTIILAIMLIRCNFPMAMAMLVILAKKQEKLVLISVVAFFGLLVGGFCVPHAHVTIWSASSTKKSQLLFVVVYILMIPIVLTYTVYSNYVFRGKVLGLGY